MERRDFFKKMGLFAAMFGIGGKLKAQDAQPAEKKAEAAIQPRKPIQVKGKEAMAL